MKLKVIKQHSNLIMNNVHCVLHFYCYNFSCTFIDMYFIFCHKENFGGKNVPHNLELEKISYQNVKHPTKSKGKRIILKTLSLHIIYILVIPTVFCGVA